MMKRLVLAVAILSALCGSAGLAQADIIFTLGNNPQPDEENILLNKGTSGSTVFGDGNKSGVTVAFSSMIDTLTEPANGQARIESQSGMIHDITVSVPGGVFTDLILNPRVGTGMAMLTGVANEPGGGTMDFTFDYALGNGENFVTITTSGGETIASLTVDAPDGFTDLQQPRISGAGSGAVPGPANLALLTFAGLGLLAYGWRRQQAA